MSRRLIRRITDKPGTISDDRGKTAKVRFSLTQWQEMLERTIPGMQSASGNIEFKATADARHFMDSPDRAILRGGGIEATINLLTETTFDVTGTINDLPTKQRA